METTTHLFRALRPKMIILILGSLFFAGVLQAQPTEQQAPIEENAQISPELQAQPCPYNTSKAFYHHRHQQHAQGRSAWLNETLQLTPEQQTQLQGIAQKLREDRRALMPQTIETREKLNNALYQPQLDKELITSLQEQQNKLRLESSNLMHQARVQALETLTAEQRQILAEQMTQRKGLRMGQRMHNKPHRSYRPCAQTQQEQNAPADLNTETPARYEQLLLPAGRMRP